MELGDRIKEILEEEGVFYKEKGRTIYSVCPGCGKSDKLSIRKMDGACICYRGSCGFRGYFEDWLAATAGITRKDAQKRINGLRRLKAYDGGEQLLRALDENNDDPIELETVEWPRKDCIPIDSPIDEAGALYMEFRGIPRQLAKMLGIMYCPADRRVVIPVMLNGICYGWQARAIYPCSHEDRMRNNKMFPRGIMVLFEDQLATSDHVIIAEGPFSSIKFWLAGGNIATLGKEVTRLQLERIKFYRPKKVYLALDDDAIDKMRDLARKFSVPVYRVRVPQSAVERSVREGKEKADFGECTFDECLQALRDAELVDESYLWT